MYIDTNGKLYSDVLLETPFKATVGDVEVQVEAINTNTLVVGGVTYIKLTASTYEVENEDGNKIVLNPDNIICEVEDGVPATTNYEVIEPTTPTEEPIEAPTEAPTEEPTEQPGG